MEDEFTEVYYFTRGKCENWRKKVKQVFYNEAAVFEVDLIQGRIYLFFSLCKLEEFLLKRSQYLKEGTDLFWGVERLTSVESVKG